MLFSFQWGGANHNRARRSAGAKPGVADRRASNRLSKLRAKTTYGSWADGYINFYGIWCEPLDLELVQKLNSKLASVQRPQK